MCESSVIPLLLGRDILPRWLQETGKCQPGNSCEDMGVCLLASQRDWRAISWQSVPACPKKCAEIGCISLQACSEAGRTVWCGKAFIICSLFWHLFRAVSKLRSDPLPLGKCIIWILLICKNLRHSFKEKVLVMVLHCCFSSCYSIPVHNSFIFILVVIHNTVKEIFFPLFESIVLWLSEMSCHTIQNCQSVFQSPITPFHNAFWVSNQM